MFGSFVEPALFECMGSFDLYFWVIGWVVRWLESVLDQRGLLMGTISKVQRHLNLMHDDGWLIDVFIRTELH